MKKIAVLLLIFIGYNVYSQNEIDAFRFSEAFYSGTARSMSMAGAFGALGSDLSVASTNPAGLGVFKSSNVSFSPSFILNNSDATYNGTKAGNDNLTMIVNNAGVNFGIYNISDDLKALNFAMGYNRYNNFSQNYSITGKNDKGSMLDYFMLDANGTSPNNLNSFSTFLAWDTYLLDTLPGSLNYTNPLWWGLEAGETPTYGQTVTKTGQVRGGAGETFFSVGVNYTDFFYFGATLGLQSFSYNSLTIYEEKDFGSNDLKSFDFTEKLITTGEGVNFKAGFLLKPFNFVRIGGAFHSPTYFTINEDYQTFLNSHWNTPDNNNLYDYSQETYNNNNDYNLLTPLRLIGNLGFVIGNFALLGADYEFVDYSGMRLSGTNYMYTQENSNINSQFTYAHNLKFGAELRLGMVSLRGGYAMFGNPYTDKTISYDKSQITGGIGFASEHVYLDFAVVIDEHLTNQFFYNGYVDEPIASVNSKSNLLNVTCGFRF